VIIFRAKRANGVWPKCMRDIRTGHLCTRTEASVPAEHIDCVAPDALPPHDVTGFLRSPLPNHPRLAYGNG